MTKAFNDFLKEFEKKVVETTVERILHDYYEGYTDKEITEDDLISLMATYEDRDLKELWHDVDHCLTEDTADMITEAREYLEKEGFTVKEDDEDESEDE